MNWLGMITKGIVEEYKFKSMGLDVTIYPLAQIIDERFIQIGNRVIIDDFVFLYGKGGIILGDFVHLGVGSMVTGGGGFVMEDFSSLSGGVRVYTNNEDYLGGHLTNPTIPDKYRLKGRGLVKLEKHVMIGANSVILPGVRIGEGTTVGACSLVTKDLPPWIVAGGVPAVFIKERKKDVIPKLEAMLREEFYDKDGKFLGQGKRSS